MACYLPDGYSGPTWIPHNDKDDAKIPEGDDDGSIDIPSPSNVLVATDQGSFKLSYRYGSFALSISIEICMQQIITSVAAMNGCLIEI